MFCLLSDYFIWLYKLLGVTCVVVPVSNVNGTNMQKSSSTTSCLHIPHVAALPVWVWPMAWVRFSQSSSCLPHPTKTNLYSDYSLTRGFSRLTGANRVLKLSAITTAWRTSSCSNELSDFPFAFLPDMMQCSTSRLMYNSHIQYSKI